MIPSEVLQSAVDLLIKKGLDYQNPKSNITQAEYYPHGCDTILDIMHAKLLRIRSVIDAMKTDPEYQPNFESLKDSGVDLINYSAFFCSYLDGDINGQKEDRDFLNRKKI